MPAVNQEAERIIKGMKKNRHRFKKLYGDRDKEVMYATANKLAQKEQLKVMYYKDFINIVEGNPTTRMLSKACLLYTSPSPRDLSTSRMPSSA